MPGVASWHMSPLCAASNHLHNVFCIGDPASVDLNRLIMAVMHASATKEELAELRDHRDSGFFENRAVGG